MTLYAHSRRLDGVTGDWATDAAGTYAESPSPALERVQLALRTQLGTCRANPTFGVDWAKVDKLRASAVADATAVITAGLAYLVRDRSIADLQVTVDVTGTRLAYAVDFLDVRLGTRRAARGTA